MYDKRESYKISEKALSFNFQPNKYEIWAGGSQIDRGNLNGKIQCIPSILSQSQSEIKVFNFPEKLNIRHTLLFDLTFTCGDRIHLATIPNETNINNYDSFRSFKSNVPLGFNIITRQKRDFEENEPYVCSVFTTNNKIVKISFSFGNQPRLLELYATQENANNNKKLGVNMAYKLIEELIEEWDDGDARISENAFINTLKSEFPEFDSNEDTVKELIVFINSIFPSNVALTRYDNEFMASSSWVIMTEYRKSDLYSLLNKLEELR